MKNKYKRQASDAPAANRPTPGGPIAFNPDYTPVIRDLKRIGILASLFIAILFGLAIAMPYLMP
jgi:hypothetical protein